MAMMMVTKGPAVGEKISLTGHRLLMIGRDARCTVQIVDPQLSRFHVQIEYAEAEKRYYAIDQESKNGVYINGTKVEVRTALQDRDVITIGDTTLVFSEEESPFAEHALELLKRQGQGHLHTRTMD